MLIVVIDCSHICIDYSLLRLLPVIIPIVMELLREKFCVRRRKRARVYTASAWRTVATEHAHRYPKTSTVRSLFVLAAVTQCASASCLPRSLHKQSLPEPPQSLMILTCAMRCAQRRSLRQEQELLQHHAGVRSAAAWQHGMDGADDHTSEMTFIAVILQRLRV